MLIKIPESASVNSHTYKPAAQSLMDSLGVEKCHNNPTWPLPNMKESTESEFWHYRTGHNFSSEAWCGNVVVDGKHATMMVYGVTHGHRGDGGFAILFFYEYPLEKARTEYYTFSKCDHEFNCENIGRCEHRYTCAKCNKSYEVDSSG